MGYAVCLECTVPTGKKRWFEIIITTTPEECKRSYDEMKKEHPDAKYAMAIEGLNANYHSYVDSVIRKMFWSAANYYEFYDINMQAFAIQRMLDKAIKKFEETHWQIDAPTEFIQRMETLSAFGWGGEVNHETQTLKWVNHNYMRYIPLPYQGNVPEGCYMLHDATPDEFYFDDHGVRFETELKCDKDGWFHVVNDPNGLFEGYAISFISENNLSPDTKLRILINPRKNDCKIEIV